MNEYRVTILPESPFSETVPLEYGAYALRTSDAVFAALRKMEWERGVQSEDVEVSTRLERTRIRRKTTKCWRVEDG